MNKKNFIAGVFAFGCLLSTTSGASSVPLGAGTNPELAEKQNLATAIQKAKKAIDTFNPKHKEVAASFAHYSGQNITSVIFTNYAELYANDECTLEGLAGLYLALQDFQKQDGMFEPEELNDKSTRQNFEFLEAIFEGVKLTDTQ